MKYGDMTVTEYEMKFVSLARFAFVQLTDDIFKATHFEAGLWPNIRWALKAFTIVRYADMVIRSLDIEPREIEIKSECEASTPTKNVQAGSSRQQRKKLKHHTFSTPQSFQRPPTYP